MNIVLNDIGKKYTNEWIFKSVNVQFNFSESYAITGHNGSGKSTLLQIILGSTLPTKGKVTLPFPKNDMHEYVSFVAPYQQLPLELTLQELLNIHTLCKPIIMGNDDFLEEIHLKDKKDKLLHFFSSGMIQRLKLGLAIYAKAPILLLDEPIISLDQKNINWYSSAINKIKEKKLIIISSNDEKEYNFCNEIIDITSFKP